MYQCDHPSKLDEVIRAVSFSPNGQLVVAGLGGAARRKGEWKDRVVPGGEVQKVMTYDTEVLVISPYH